MFPLVSSVWSRKLLFPYRQIFLVPLKSKSSFLLDSLRQTHYSRLCISSPISLSVHRQNSEVSLPELQEGLEKLRLGQKEAAELLFERSVQILSKVEEMGRRSSVKDSSPLIDSLKFLFDAQALQRKFSLAEKTSIQLLRLVESKRTPLSSSGSVAIDNSNEETNTDSAECIEQDYLDTLKRLVFCYEKQEKYDEALGFCDQLVQFVRRKADFEAISSSLLEMGNIYLEKEQFHNAELCFQQALTSMERNNIANPLLKAQALNDLGTLYLLRNQHSVAEQFFQTSSQVLEHISKDVNAKSEGKTNPIDMMMPLHANRRIDEEKFTSLCKLGELKLIANEFSKAEELLKSSLKLLEQAEKPSDSVVTEPDPRLIECLFGLARVYHGQRKLVYAEGLYRRVLQMSTELRAVNGGSAAFSSLRKVTRDQQRFRECFTNLLHSAGRISEAQQLERSK